MDLLSTIDILASGTSEGASKAWDTRGRGRKAQQHSDKVERALKSYVPVTKDKRRIATLNEAVVAKLVGGKHTNDSEEFDVLLPGKRIGIEVKTAFENRVNAKITQHPESLERKHMFMDAEKYKRAYTVIFDRKEDKIYVAKGLGSFRFDRPGRVEEVTLKTLASKIK